jgi:DNA polymerase-3 subunit delta'
MYLTKGKAALLGGIEKNFLSGKLSHALLLGGEKGIGKKTLADEICKIIVCENDKKPCGNCNPCRKIEKGIHPDIFKINPSGKTQMKLEDIKVIFDRVYLKPNDAEYKVFIINQAEKMSSKVQNALLKIIEEPPEDAFFIFLCQNPSSLLPTVRSRVTEMRVPYAEENEVKDILSQSFASMSNENIGEISRKSRGNVGLGFELCENSELLELYKDVENIVSAICNKDRAILCLALSKYSKNKNDALEMINLLKLVFRDTLSILAGTGDIVSGMNSAAKMLSSFCSSKSAVAVIECCDEFTARVLGNANLALALTALEINITDIIKR